MLTAEQVREMKERAEKATPGPWSLGDENNSCCEVVLGTEHNLTCSFDRQDLNTSEFVIERDEMLANAHFVLGSRTDIPALIRDREELTGMLVRALVELSYIESSVVEAAGRGLNVSEAKDQLWSAEGAEILESGMKLLGLKSLHEDELKKLKGGS